VSEEHAVGSAIMSLLRIDEMDGQELKRRPRNELVRRMMATKGRPGVSVNNVVKQQNAMKTFIDTQKLPPQNLLFDGHAANNILVL
jgi:hypothetical protein